MFNADEVSHGIIAAHAVSWKDYDFYKSSNWSFKRILNVRGFKVTWIHAIWALAAQWQILGHVRDPSAYVNNQHEMDVGYSAVCYRGSRYLQGKQHMIIFICFQMQLNNFMSESNNYDDTCRIISLSREDILDGDWQSRIVTLMVWNPIRLLWQCSSLNTTLSISCYHNACSIPPSWTSC